MIAAVCVSTTVEGRLLQERVLPALARVAKGIKPVTAARMAIRSGLLSAAIDTAVGGVEAWWAVREGVDTETARTHVLRKASCGFVVSAAGTICVLAATGVAGPGVVAFAAGSLGAAGAARLFNHAVGPSPLAEARKAAAGRRTRK